MKRVNPYDFYEMAAVVHPLTEVVKGSTVGQNFYPLIVGRGQIQSLLSNDFVPLRVARQATEALLERIEELLPAEGAGEQAKLGRTLTDWEVYQITEAAKKFETVLAAELQTVDTYYIDQKRAYSTSDLIERAEIIFSEDSRRDLPAGAIDDVRQAGRALVLDLPTAAGFHILRATEAVVREYYTVVVKTAPTKRDWGHYVAELKSKGADARIAGAIDQLRDLQRNPLMHPEVMLNEDEAVMLFGMAQGVMVAIMGDIAKRNPGLAKRAAATVATISEG